MPQTARLAAPMRFFVNPEKVPFSLFFRRFTLLVHHFDMVVVGGSIPLAPTTFAQVRSHSSCLS
jgi:hypothetical protein